MVFSSIFLRFDRVYTKKIYVIFTRYKLYPLMRTLSVLSIQRLKHWLIEWFNMHFLAFCSLLRIQFIGRYTSEELIPACIQPMSVFLSKLNMILVVFPFAPCIYYLGLKFPLYHCNNFNSMHIQSIIERYQNLKTYIF